MTTFSLTGTWGISSDIDGGPFIDAKPVTLYVSYDGPIDTLDFRVSGGVDDYDGNVTLTNLPDVLRLDGAAVAPLSLDAYFWDLQFEDGTSSTVLLLDPDRDNMEAIFHVGGDPLPVALSTAADLNALFRLDPQVATAEDLSLDIASIPGASFLPDPVVPADRTGTEAADDLRGTGGNDRLIGLGGDDTLSGGDGADTISGGDGNDVITGGATVADLRDVVYGGDGDDRIDGGFGNDLLYGGAGADVIAGGFGADTVVGNEGADVLTGGALGDMLVGGDGFDFLNGGFGSDRLNGGAGPDRFFHLGVFDHGSDWVQDYSSAEGDRLVWGRGEAAGAARFQVNYADTPGAGAAGTAEAFVIDKATGQILWALVDGADETIRVQVGTDVFEIA